jgi:TolA-binding protein
MTGTLISLPQQEDAATMANAFLEISTEYPGTPAGQRALLQGAATLFSAGKYKDAQSYFQQYLDAHPDGDFAGQASLGVAKSLEAEGQLNQAAGAYQHVISDIADAQAVVEAKFSLGRVDMEGHNYADAERLFAEVAQTDPYGALGSEAAQYAYELKSKVPTTPPATTPTTAPAGQFKLN